MIQFQVNIAKRQTLAHDFMKKFQNRQTLVQLLPVGQRRLLLFYFSLTMTHCMVRQPSSLLFYFSLTMTHCTVRQPSSLSATQSSQTAYLQGKHDTQFRSESNTVTIRTLWMFRKVRTIKTTTTSLKHYYV